MPALEIINLSARVYRSHVVGLVLITLLPQSVMLGVEALVGGMNLAPGNSLMACLMTSSGMEAAP